MARELISFQSVSKTYGDNPLDYKSLILKNVYLSIMPGEFLIVFGPSGSGKSTMLNLMAGLEFPTAGKVMVRGRNLARFESEELAQYHRQKMGMVFQSFNLLKSLNVWENVALPQTANQVRFGLRKKRAMRLLKLLNINQYAYRRPSEVSGGEQQRVAIARALINNPYFLLVDEPTGNLDSESAQEVMDILHGLNRHGKHTIVLVTHNPDYLHYATRVVYFQDGKIVKEERHERPAEPATQPIEKGDLQRLGEYKDESVKGMAEAQEATTKPAPAPVPPPVAPPPAEPATPPQPTPPPQSQPPQQPTFEPVKTATSDTVVLSHPEPLKAPLPPDSQGGPA